MENIHRLKAEAARGKVIKDQAEAAKAKFDKKSDKKATIKATKAAATA